MLFIDVIYMSKITDFVSNKNNYLSEILKNSNTYLKSIFNNEEYNSFILEVNKITKEDKKEFIFEYTKVYHNFVKQKYILETSPKYNKKLNEFVNANKNDIKIVWGNCLNLLKQLPSESIKLMVTSPPYYNAREYSQWKNLNEYLDDMRKIIQESYRVLDNHRVWVFNVGDIFDNDNLVTKSVWGDRRLPLGAYFIKIFEDCGFTFVDDFIWDKGEVQTQRHKNGSTPYAFYQYPANCYEHILIFHKHRLDKTRYPCLVCGSLKVSGNTQSEIGLQSWECKNNDCPERSASNRGKRFSLKSIFTQNSQNQANVINHDLIKKWRRDIIKFSPVIKINSKGDNTLGHTAPFPNDIPEMAINFFSYKGETILDPFAGSFTTPIIANKLNRIGVGCELRKDLFKKAIVNNITKHKINFEEFNLL